MTDVRTTQPSCGKYSVQKIPTTPYLTALESSKNEVGPVPLVLDLRITHERWGSSPNPSLNGRLHYPADIDRTLNEVVSDKIL